MLYLLSLITVAKHHAGSNTHTRSITRFDRTVIHSSWPAGHDGV
jgi:hypothetical protein